MFQNVSKPVSECQFHRFRRFNRFRRAVQVACSCSCFVESFHGIPALGTCCFWDLCGVKAAHNRAGFSPVIFSQLCQGVCTWRTSKLHSGTAGVRARGGPCLHLSSLNLRFAFGLKQFLESRRTGLYAAKFDIRSADSSPRWRIADSSDLALWLHV